MIESVFAARRLRRFVRSGDGRKFRLEIERDGDNIVARIAADAIAKLIVLTTYTVTKVKRKDCVVYDGYPENIVLRAVAAYVANRFRVALPNRDRSVRGVIEAMFDQTPFYVIKRDISSFYENIPLEPTRSRLLYDTAIPRAVRHYLHDFFQHHGAGKTRGLPRGVGLTTVLVELAMQPFDDAVRAIPGVYRYFRYSDDILIFSYKEPDRVALELRKAIRKVPGMAYNEAKSDMKAFAGDMNPPGLKKGPGLEYTRAAFDYLGYSFEAEQRGGDKSHRKVFVSIARKKIKLMRTRVYLAFKSFEKSHDVGMLYDRMRVLTGNYRINRRGISAIARSKHIYAGIYYNYWRCGTYVSGRHEPSFPLGLRDVDRFYHSHLKSKASHFRHEIDTHIAKPQLDKLGRISFERGFVGRRVVRVPFSRFAKLKAVWRNA